MTNKIKLLIGLLALGLILVGSSTWFLLNPVKQELKIGVSPAPGSYLLNSFGESSEVLLKDIRINTEINDKHYFSPSYPAHTVDTGEYILVVNGSVQNQHPENSYIGMYAEGYDETGKQVAWTLDAAHVAGQIGLHLENGKTGELTLHLNFSKNIKSICIFAFTSPIPIP